MFCLTVMFNKENILEEVKGVLGRPLEIERGEEKVVEEVRGPWPGIFKVEANFGVSPPWWW